MLWKQAVQLVFKKQPAENKTHDHAFNFAADSVVTVMSQSLVKSAWSMKLHK